MDEDNDDTLLSHEQLGISNDLHINMMRCLIMIKNKKESKRKKNIFSIYVVCNKQCLLVIHSGNVINVISINTLAKANLKVEPHSKLFYLVL